MPLWAVARRGRRRRRRPARRRARGAAGRPRPRAAAGQGAVPRAPRSPAARAAGRRRRAGRRQVPPGLGVREVRRRPRPRRSAGTAAGASPTARASPTTRWPRRCGAGCGWPSTTTGRAVTTTGPAASDGLASVRPRPDERAWLRRASAPCSAPARSATFAREDLFVGVDDVLRAGRATATSPSCWSSTTRSTPTTACSPSSSTCSRRRRFPCFVLLLARPGCSSADPALADQPAGHRAPPRRRCPTRDMARAGRRPGRRPARRTCATQLVERAEGIPLFAVETVRSLIDRDLVVPRGGQYVLADPDGLDLARSARRRRCRR